MNNDKKFRLNSNNSLHFTFWSHHKPWCRFTLIAEPELYYRQLPLYVHKRLSDLV